ncbi:hypothetical protein JCM10450v2_007793 [Rhodotorula kratochvilovae]
MSLRLGLPTTAPAALARAAASTAAAAAAFCAHAAGITSSAAAAQLESAVRFSHSDIVARVEALRELQVWVALYIRTAPLAAEDELAWGCLRDRLYALAEAEPAARLPLHARTTLQNITSLLRTLFSQAGLTGVNGLAALDLGRRQPGWTARIVSVRELHGALRGADGAVRREEVRRALAEIGAAAEGRNGAWDEAGWKGAAAAWIA